ncbi:hypothetical protein LINGRAPRIM_LOCUS2787, partial [Linum grandiflorum]
LTDLSPIGPLFTWTNRQSIVAKSCLDRCLLSPSWIALFPHSVTHNFSDNGSDHRAILLLDSLEHKGPKKYFSFN